jgi:cell division protein FtsZ
MEVNEASCVIQEAAHEDANIIFGAVVDPSLKGKVKITVIATGFDRAAGSRAVPAAAVQTPVDLQNYTAHLARVAEGGSSPQQPALEMSADPASTASPLTVTRRPALELTLPIAEGGDHSSPLDVPAFLRRPN